MIECRKCGNKQESTVAVVDAYVSNLAQAALVSVAAEFMQKGHAETGRTGAEAFTDSITREKIDKWKQRMGCWQTLSLQDKANIADEIQQWQAGNTFICPKHSAEMAALTEEWKRAKTTDFAARVQSLLDEGQNPAAMDDRERRALHNRVKQVQEETRLFLVGDAKTQLQALREGLAKDIAWKWWEFFGR